MRIDRVRHRATYKDQELLDFDMLQTGHGGKEVLAPSIRTLRTSYESLPTMPVVNGEVCYEALLDRIPAEVPRLMFWASYLLAMDPEQQSSVRKEIVAFPTERISGLDDIQNWPRLRNVLLEALRLYPPAPHIVRDANGPDDICGEKIDTNTQVWISPWVMHRHRRFWDRPTAFLPGRFGA